MACQCETVSIVLVHNIYVVYAGHIILCSGAPPVHHKVLYTYTIYDITETSASSACLVNATTDCGGACVSLRCVLKHIHNITYMYEQYNVGHGDGSHRNQNDSHHTHALRQRKPNTRKHKHLREAFPPTFTWRFCCDKIWNCIYIIYQ